MGADDMSHEDRSEDVAAALDDFVRISTVSDLTARVRANRQSERNLWYRGQANEKWSVIPKLARNRGFLRRESLMLKHFKQDASPRLREKPASPWEWIFLAQHYGLPTRLLDWSENPLIGLYFAVESNDADMEFPVNGALFELDAERLNTSTLGREPGDVLMFDHDSELDTYLPSSNSGPRMGPLAGIASRVFDRIIAQSGTFTVTHLDHDLSLVQGSERFLRKLVVPAADKPMIREELADLNIRASTVYPDLDHLATYVMERHSS